MDYSDLACPFQNIFMSAVGWQEAYSLEALNDPFVIISNKWEGTFWKEFWRNWPYGQNSLKMSLPMTKLFLWIVLTAIKDL